MTEEEKTSAKNNDEVAVSTEKLELTAALIGRVFGLDSSYVVTNFRDRNDSVEITMENPDYSLSVKVKRPSQVGLVTDAEIA